MNHYVHVLERLAQTEKKIQLAWENWQIAYILYLNTGLSSNCICKHCLLKSLVLPLSQLSQTCPMHSKYFFFCHFSCLSWQWVSAIFILKKGSSFKMIHVMFSSLFFKFQCIKKCFSPNLNWTASWFYIVSTRYMFVWYRCPHSGITVTWKQAFCKRMELEKGHNCHNSWLTVTYQNRSMMAHWFVHSHMILEVQVDSPQRW